MLTVGRRQLTIWFPLHLRRAIAIVAPKVDRYTELGTRRSHSDMDREYQRLRGSESHAHCRAMDEMLQTGESHPEGTLRRY